MKGNDSIGRPSRACGKSTSEAGRRAISAPAETCLIVIAPCCSGTSSGVTPICCRVSPAAEECLLVPFYVRGKAVGAIWAMMHSDRRRFDAEDQRLMTVLGQFASLAYQTLSTIDDLKSQIDAREKAESRLRELTRVEVGVILDGLEAQVRTRRRIPSCGCRNRERRRGEYRPQRRYPACQSRYHDNLRLRTIGVDWATADDTDAGIPARLARRQASSATRKPVIGT